MIAFEPGSFQDPSLHLLTPALHASCAEILPESLISSLIFQMEEDSASFASFSRKRSAAVIRFSARYMLRRSDLSDDLSSPAGRTRVPCSIKAFPAWGRRPCRSLPNLLPVRALRPSDRQGEDRCDHFTTPFSPHAIHMPSVLSS